MTRSETLKMVFWWALFIALWFVLFASTGKAQCGPGGCGIPAPATTRPQWRPSAPAVVSPHSRYTCRIVVHLQGGRQSYGSGVLIISRGERSYVLTAAHGYDEPRERIVVYFAGEAPFEGRLIKADHDRDLALILIATPRRARPIHLSLAAIPSGTPMVAAGYAAGQTHIGPVRCILRGIGRLARGACLILSGTIRGGYSGGALVHQDRLVGLLVATGEGETIAVDARTIDGFLTGIFAQPDAPAPPSSPPAPQDDAAQPNLLPPDAPDGEGCAASEQIAALQAEIVAIKATIAALQPIPGPAGPQGPRGERGPPGPAGQDAAVTPIPIDEIKQQILAALPPIYFRKIDGLTGNVVGQPEAVHLGEGFDFITYPHEAMHEPVGSSNAR